MEFLGSSDLNQGFGCLSAALSYDAIILMIHDGLEIEIIDYPGSNLTQSLEGTWQLPLLGLFCRFLTETAISVSAL